jgi:hypothetical protein
MGKQRTAKNGKMNPKKYESHKETIDILAKTLSNAEIARATGWSSATTRLIKLSKNYDDYVKLQKMRNGTIKPGVSDAWTIPKQGTLTTTGGGTLYIPQDFTVTDTNQLLTNAINNNTDALNRLTEILSKARKVKF